MNEPVRVAREPLTRRAMAIGGIDVHAGASLVSNSMAVWTPLLEVHAYGTFRRVPDDADHPVQLPTVVVRRRVGD